MVRSAVRGSPAIGDANAIVTPASYERLLSSLEPSDRVLPLTRFERPAPGEANAIERMARRAASTVIEIYCEGRRTDQNIKAMRDQHAKGHGCLRASFIVRDDVPPEFALGVFRPGARYAAIVRFSNAQGTRNSDRVPDGRGMAIKLLNVPGPSILPCTPKASPEQPPSAEQDFLLTNYPIFFGKNVNDYTEFLELIALPQDNWSERLKRLTRLFFFFVPRRLRQLWIFIATAVQRVDSPLRAVYHSMTPYLLGGDKVVRYVAAPLQTTRARGTGEWQTPGDDFLRRALVAELDSGKHSHGDKAIFDFSFQLRDRATPDDVEDASRPWRGAKDVRVSLARIEISLQNFETASRWYLGENLSFSPWHCLPEHRPLGGLNRMRLAVYRASLQVRHRLNMLPK